ncbi:MAG TPA: type II toxin-antitoxin system VapC family toxin [Acidobacteriota bacterium]
MIVLDTHVWVWWVSDPRELSARSRRLIEESRGKNAVYISSISVWEVALLVARNRLKLRISTADWIARSEALPFLNFVPVDNQIAFRSASLPEPLHSDPADRIIIATAVSHDATLISKDEKILGYPHVRATW